MSKHNIKNDMICHILERHSVSGYNMSCVYRHTRVVRLLMCIGQYLKCIRLKYLNEQYIPS